MSEPSNKIKDYTAYVDFPVEIMGRDGKIRHYSFEESVLLYQRRIRLSRLRYAEPQKIQKEVDHCSRRISQLRRSYFARYGWEAFVFKEPIPENLSTEVSGEISAYLRRKYGTGVHRSPAILQCLEDGKDQVIFSIVIDDWQGILYILKDDSSLNQLIHNFGNGVSLEQERVVDIHDSLDFFCLLTSVSENALEEKPVEDIVKTFKSTLGVEALSQGKVLEAMAHFMIIIDENPYNRQAYWGAAILAEQLRVHHKAKLILDMAIAYFPNDLPLLCRKAAVEFRLQLLDDYQITKAKIHSLDKRYSMPIINIIEQILDGHIYFGLRRLNRLNTLNQNPLLTTTIKWLTKELKKAHILQRLVFLSFVMWVFLSWTLHAAFLLGVIASIGLLWLARQILNGRINRALIGVGFHQLYLLGAQEIQLLNVPLEEEH